MAENGKTIKNLTIDLENYKKDGTVFKRKAVRAIITRKTKSGETELLMIHGKYGDYKFPGGGAEQGETTLETLHREVLEETGFEVQNLDEYEYKTIWIKPAEAIARNESVKDFENIPWIKREAMVLREILKGN